MIYFGCARKKKKKSSTALVNPTPLYNLHNFCFKNKRTSVMSSFLPQHTPHAIHIGRKRGRAQILMWIYSEKRVWVNPKVWSHECQLEETCELFMSSSWTRGDLISLNPLEKNSELAVIHHGHTVANIDIYSIPHTSIRSGISLQESKYLYKFYTQEIVVHILPNLNEWWSNIILNVGITQEEIFWRTAVTILNVIIGIMFQEKFNNGFPIA